MPVHVIADIKVTNDAWVKDYVTSVHNLVHKHGGKYLSRVGARTTPTAPSDKTFMSNGPVFGVMSLRPSSS